MTLPFILVRVAAWTLLAAILIMTLGPPSFRPTTDLAHGLEHAAAFAALGGLFSLGYRTRIHLLFAAAIVVCAGLEIAQLYVPGRHARLGDFIVDSVAACAGLMVGRLGGHRIRDQI